MMVMKLILMDVLIANISVKYLVQSAYQDLVMNVIHLVGDWRIFFVGKSVEMDYKLE